MTSARVWSNVVVSTVCSTTTKSVPERTTSDNVATARMRVTIDIRLNLASIMLLPPPPGTGIGGYRSVSRMRDFDHPAGCNKTGVRRYSRGRFHLLLPAVGVTTQGQASEGGGQRRSYPRSLRHRSCSKTAA